MDRYTVISADCHAGADLHDYKPFLESRYHEVFDDWVDDHVNPFGDLVRPDADRNWNSAKRTSDLEADGVVAEVIYPNTVPPFYPKEGLTSVSPTAEEYELRLAGLPARRCSQYVAASFSLPSSESPTTPCAVSTNPARSNTCSSDSGFCVSTRPLSGCPC